MQTNKKIVISILLLSIFMVGCRKNNQGHKIAIAKDTSSIKKQEDVLTRTNELKIYTNESFVISCGSGCAMNYAPEEIIKDSTTIKVKFNVKMYIDEALSDTYTEAYIFYYDKNDKLYDIKTDKKSDFFLTKLMPDTQDSFIKFGQKIILIDTTPTK